MSDKILDSYIGVTSGMSGWFAIECVLVDDPELGEYWDIQQTGVGRYKERRQAVLEAISWSESDEIKLANGLREEIA